MTEWKKAAGKKKKYQHTKVPTVKLCMDCHQTLQKRADRCTACEMHFQRTRTRRTAKDEEYRLALLKHVL